MLALLLYLGFDGLASLYVVSALFGLVQGGIVPSYAIIDPRILAAARSRHARRHGHHGHAVRHGARRLDVRRDLRPHRLVQRRVRQRRLWNLLNAGIALALLTRSVRRIAPA